MWDIDDGFSFGGGIQFGGGNWGGGISFGNQSPVYSQCPGGNCGGYGIGLQSSLPLLLLGAVVVILLVR